MGDLQHNRIADRLDIVSPEWSDGEPEGYILFNAIQAHLSALFDNLLVAREDDFFRTLYIELRLYFDQQMFETKSGVFGYLKGKGKA